MKDPSLSSVAPIQNLGNLFLTLQAFSTGLARCLTQVPKLKWVFNTNLTLKCLRSPSSLSVVFDWFTFRLKEGLAKASGAAGDGHSEGKGGAENEFVRASKEKFSDAQQAAEKNSVFNKLR